MRKQIKRMISFILPIAILASVVSTGAITVDATNKDSLRASEKIQIYSQWDVDAYGSYYNRWICGSGCGLLTIGHALQWLGIIERDQENSNATIAKIFVDSGYAGTVLNSERTATLNYIKNKYSNFRFENNNNLFSILNNNGVALIHKYGHQYLAVDISSDSQYVHIIDSCLIVPSQNNVPVYLYDTVQKKFVGVNLSQCAARSDLRWYCSDPNTNSMVKGNSSNPLYAGGDYWVSINEVSNYAEIGMYAPCSHDNTELRNAKEPTYYEDGYTGDTYCLDCGKKIATGTVIPATPLPSPIKEIKIDPISIIERTDGYYTSYSPETGEYGFEYFRYAPEYKLRYEITFNDDSIISGDYFDSFEYDGEEYGVSVTTDQSYNKQWTVGNTYEATVSALGKSVTVPVTIVPSPIKEIKIDPISVTEGIDGYYDTDWNPETGDYDLEYYRYDLYNRIRYEITFTDDTVIRDGGSVFEYGDDWYSFDVSTDQSYDNQWTVGNTYEVTVSALGKRVTVPVTIVPSPIKEIKIDPISVIEGTNGYYDTSYNPETEEWDLEYYRYIPDSYKFRYEITFNDNSVISGNGRYFEYNGEEYWLSAKTDQSYDNQWVAGNTYEATVSTLGKRVTVPVTIVPSPIKEIKIDPISIIEGTNGWYVWDLEYYEYEPEYKLRYEITFTDGSVIRGTDSFEYDGEEYSFDVSTDQSYDNQWTVGNTYEMTVSALGKSVTVPVTITPSPIKEIKIEPISVVEGTNGYYDTDWNPETGYYDLEYYRYYSPTIHYEITFTDGTVIRDSDDGFYYDEDWYSFDISTDQSYDNQWTVGNTYEVTVSVMGKRVTVPVTIVPSSVKNIRVLGELVHMGDDEEGFIVSDPAFIKFEVEFEDGTKQTCNWNPDDELWVHYGGDDYRIHFDYDIPVEDWHGAGVYSLPVQCGSLTRNADVTVIENPYKALRIDETDNVFTLIFTKKDNTEEKHTVLSFDPRALEGVAIGIITTDRGVFSSARLDYDPDDYGKDVSLTIWGLTSNEITDCHWLKVGWDIMRMQTTAFDSYRLHTYQNGEKVLGYFGKDTDYDVDDLAGATYIREHDGFTDVEYDDDWNYIVKVSELKEAVKKVFGIDNFDVTNSKYYNPETPDVFLILGQGWGDGPSAIRQTYENGNWVCVYPSSFMKSDYQYIRVTMDDDLIVQSVEYLNELTPLVPVTAVSLDKTKATIGVGETLTLTPMIAPLDASNRNVIWSTDDSSIATVENGVVTGVSAGTVTVTATTKDGKFTASCTVTVKDFDKMLVTKLQITNNTQLTDETTNLRFTSTVDNLTDYKEVGFYITMNGKTLRYSTQTVYSVLVGSSGGTILTYKPTDWCEDSQYFITYTLNMRNVNFNKDITVQSFVVLKDDSEIKGALRETSVAALVDLLNNYSPML